MSTSDFDHYDPEQPMYCANHPNVETFLRCARCGKPICAKCRVSTPAGFRCFTCANLQVLPTYAVSADYYVKSFLAGDVVAVILGTLMGLFPAFEFWAALIMGIAVPEAVGAAANQKRGPGLQMVAVGAVVFGFVVSRVVMSLPLRIDLLGINTPARSGIDAFESLPFYLTQYSILWLALAIFLAYKRMQ